MRVMENGAPLTLEFFPAKLGLSLYSAWYRDTIDLLEGYGDGLTMASRDLSSHQNR
jgi:hypothetical protein